MIKTNNIEFKLRQKIIKLALLQLNKQYKHGDMGPDTFDCAGFVWFLYNNIFNINIFENGFGLSTTTKIMTSNYGNLVKFNEYDLNKDLDMIKEGDILLFHRQSLTEFEPTISNKYPGHCGIYLGNNTFIHSSYPKKKVIISSLYEKKGYWLKILVGSKDIITLLSDNEKKLIKK